MGTSSTGTRNASTRSLAYALLRIAFGVNFAGHGCVRIINGVGLFATTTGTHLARSVLPHQFVIAFAYTIPFIEAALGLALIFGLFTRVAVVCASIFMMGLTVGVTSNQEWSVAGQQLLYSLVLFVLLYLIELNAYALDGLFATRRSGPKLTSSS